MLGYQHESRHGQHGAAEEAGARCRHDGKKRNYVEVGERYRWEEKKLRAKLPRHVFKRTLVCPTLTMQIWGGL